MIDTVAHERAIRALQMIQNFAADSEESDLESLHSRKVIVQWDRQVSTLAAGTIMGVE